MKKLILILLLPCSWGDGCRQLWFGYIWHGTRKMVRVNDPSGGRAKWVLSIYGQDKSPLKLIQRVPMRM